MRAHRSERRLPLVWIRAANWLGPRGSSCGSWVLRAGRAVNDTAQKARAVTLRALFPKCWYGGAYDILSDTPSTSLA